MKQIRREVISYELENGFFVDVEERKSEVDFWLYHIRGTIKVFMFGLNKKDVPVGEELEKLIVKNADYHIPDYVDEYM